MKKIHHQSGFTLIETIMVISIYTLLLLVISDNIFQLYQANGYTIAQSNEIDHARRGLQTWLQDAREMTYADDGSFPIAEMGDHHVSFYSDVEGDSSVEYVEYELDTTTLSKSIYQSTGTPPVYNLDTPYRVEVLSEFVQNLVQATTTFTYYDNDGNVLSEGSSQLTDVRYLEAKVIVNIDPLRSPGEFLLQSGVAPRNLKDNL